MKSYKFIFTILFALCCTFVHAQTSYKNVTIDRDSKDNTVIVVRNNNACSVDIRMEYKVGSKDAEWRYFDMWQNSQNWDREPNQGNTIKANTTEKFFVGEKIYALKLTYVHWNAGEIFGECVDAMYNSRHQNDSK